MSSPSQLKHVAVYVLRLIVGVLLVFAAGGTKSPAFDMVVAQLDIMGPRQWFFVLTGLGGTAPSRRIADTRASAPTPTRLAPANDNTRAGELAYAS